MKSWRRRRNGSSGIWGNRIEDIGNKKFKVHLTMRGQGTASSKCMHLTYWKKSKESVMLGYSDKRSNGYGQRGKGREGREERADLRGLARPPPTVGFKVRGFQPADHDMGATQEKPYREVLGFFDHIHSGAYNSLALMRASL